MAYILNIETSTKNCSVSIALNGENIAVKEISEAGFSHAEKLHIFFEDILKENNIAFKNLSAIAVSQGPGSYTGLRIGVSAAKGLSYSLDIPLIAVDTLKSLASQVKFNDGIIIPMIDARRMEVYSAIFNHKLEKIRAVEAQIIDENSFSAIEGKIYVVGDCQPKLKTVLTKSNFIFLDEIIYPSAKEMSTLGYQKYQNNDFVDVAYFEPYYLKDFMITTSK
ncbi:tRNA (adenosine(37)-N6)-threonylcarbamoyltransferase complex dimerization subunit type 1 TsaB [Flavobacterium sp.]|uniref:tRNA (adenosine(37)-N6)-threonylcarbamoyltransferase complex dimerization subunit type 1 TsaB n=1 Tax=Flavobacterium sp. TaxID=239 RepID=UPI00286C6A79|nr:tRNA (adenosine(37)-N6)-threonylcarbamoyltransferase complex dimerization subunit type 1 TsaB [Flavobacterium sp.]